MILHLELDCPGCHRPFRVDLEPVGRRSPRPVACPACGGDCTAVADRAITFHPDLPLRLMGESEAEPVASPPSPATVPGAVPAPAPAPPAPPEARPRRRGRGDGGGVRDCDRARAPGAFLRGLIALLVLGAIGAAAYYLFVGQRPRAIFARPLSAGNGPSHCQFLGGDALVVIDAASVALIDPRTGRERWLIDLPALGVRASGGAAPSFFADLLGAEGPIVRLVGANLWIVLADRLLLVDPGTGKIRRQLALPREMIEARDGERILMLLSRGMADQIVVTRIDLGSGEIDARTLASVSSAVVGGGMGGLLDALPSSGGADFFEPSGGAVARLQVQLVGRRIAERQTIRRPKVPAEEGGVDLMSNLAFVQETLNEVARATGAGVVAVDESTYRVILTRPFDVGVAPWVGEVQGAPSFHATASVDLVVAGRRLMAFSRDNRMLWEDTLAYPLPAASGAPCREVGGTLYLWDQGTLSAREPGTGKVRWRMPLVGVTGVEIGGRGDLYASATTASVDSIGHEGEVSLVAPPCPKVVRIDAGTGRVRWECEGGERCVSGRGRVLVGRTPQIIAAEDPLGTFSGRGTGLSYRIQALHPGSGRAAWDIFLENRPTTVEASGDLVLLGFPDEIRVLRYLALF